MGRRHDLDALRVAAMFAVVVFHAALSFFDFVPWYVKDTRIHQGFGILALILNGFQMPVFFVMSGFFTAMLWRKRGLAAVVKHRFRRIFLPLMTAAVMLVPAILWCAENVVRRFPGDPRTDISSAIAAGDTAAIRQHLANGVDVAAANQYANTPLQEAVIHDNAEAVDLLVQAGAEVDQRNPFGFTALHMAAFAGHAEPAESLLRSGAEVAPRERRGQTPFDRLKADWPYTLAAFTLAAVPFDAAEAYAGRLRIAEILIRYGADERMPALDAPRATWFLVLASPLALQHLWFLWFLCLFVPVFALFTVLADRFRYRGMPAWTMLSARRYLWLLPMTVLTRILDADIAIFAVSAAIVPDLSMLLYYGVFFFFGVLYHDSDDGGGRLGRWWKLTLPAALLIVFPASVAFTLNGAALDAPAFFARLGIVLSTTFAWLMVFSLMGMFRRLVAKERKAWRYLSDASYWIYLAHLPLMIAGQALVQPWGLPAIVKFGLLCVGVIGALIVAYQYLVRRTAIGTFLNGRRH